MKRILAIVLAILSAACSRETVERLEWTTMGTVAAVQAKGADATNAARSALSVSRAACDEVETRLNAHDRQSEISRLAALAQDEAVARCAASVRKCYEAAFRLARLSGGAFNPRWRGADTLDFGAIAKGFAADSAAERCEAKGLAALIDIGGNLKSADGEWKVAVRDPEGRDKAATLTLRRGEALATSAEYFRGRHIYDGRTGKPVANGVRSVTVLHPSSAMIADGLSTTLFVLGPEEGRRFVAENYPEVAVLWLTDKACVVADEKRRFENLKYFPLAKSRK